VATWTVALGHSGCGKSPVYNRLMEQMYEIEKDETSAYLTALADWREIQKRPDILTTHDKAAKAINESTHIPEPALPTLFMGRATIEGLRQACADKQSNGLVPALSPVVDELRVFIKSSGQYKSGRNSDLDALLELWSKGFGSTRNVNGTTPAVNDAYVVVAGGLQTGEVSERLLGDWESGMSSRWLVHHLPADHREPPASDSDDAFEQWDTRIVELYRSAAKDRVWTLSPEAADIWRAARTAWWKAGRDTGRECYLGSALDKANEQALRLMGVYAELLDLPDHTVTAEVARYAVAVVDYCLSYWRLRSDYESPIQRSGERRLDSYYRSIDRKIDESPYGVVTRTEMKRCLSRLRKNAVDEVIARWVANRLGVCATASKSINGGPSVMLLAKEAKNINQWLAIHTEYHLKV
ncbi:MAG TPA: DUF3987 domain-containing protein, partial [Candidatus Paceibacterota bacterium]